MSRSHALRSCFRNPSEPRSRWTMRVAAQRTAAAQLKAAHAQLHQVSDQSGLYRDPRSNRWPHRSHFSDYRQCREPHDRRSGHHRKSGSDVRGVSGFCPPRSGFARPLCRQGRFRCREDTAPATEWPDVRPGRQARFRRYPSGEGYRHHCAAWHHRQSRSTAKLVA